MFCASRFGPASLSPLSIVTTVAFPLAICGSNRLMGLWSPLATLLESKKIWSLCCFIQQYQIPYYSCYILWNGLVSEIMEFNSFHNSWFSGSLNSLSARLALPVGTGRKLYRWLGVTVGMSMKNYLEPLIIQNWRFPPDICSTHNCQTEANRNWRMSCSSYKYWASFKNDFCRRVPNMAFGLVPFCVLWHSVQSLNITRITILLSNFLFFLKNEKREMDGRRFFFSFASQSLFLCHCQ